MNASNPEEMALKFVECINNQDIGTTSGSHIPPEIEAKETVIWIAKYSFPLIRS
jgi:hypothetical protein